MIDGTRALYRRWKLLAAVALLAAGLGVASASLVDPVWESEVNIQVGVVYGQAIEEPRALAGFLESRGFVASVRTALNATNPVTVHAESVDGRPNGPAIYVRIVARGRSADEARMVATYVVDFVKGRHGKQFETMMRNHTEYLDTLARTLSDLEAGISRIESSLDRVDRETNQGMLAALVFQPQIDAERRQYLQIAKELRDARLQQVVNTRYTTEIGPPSTPTQPIWPARLFFAAIAAALGVFVTVVAILAYRSRATV